MHLSRRSMLGTALAPLALNFQLGGQPPKRDYDESKVRSYTLPDPLLWSNGQRVTSPAQWPKRRAEIVQMFETNMYGRFPARLPGTRYEVNSVAKDALGGRAERKLVTALLTRQKIDRTMDILIYLPKERPGPVPMFLGVNFRGNQTVNADPGIPISTKWAPYGADHRATETTRGAQANQWPVEHILERGYGLATIYSADLSPDFNGGFDQGVQPLFHAAGRPGRAPDEWGALGAWAWGMSRVMDYFETDREIDHARVAVIGHSRMGKAALWAGGYDTRFALTVSNCSGAGGAALSRRRFGESVKDLNTNFPFWFCENFKTFSDNEDALPMDQHELLALCAPRPVYVGVADQDFHADARGQFLSAMNASPVYKLLGTDGFGAKEMPPVHQPVQTTIGFHMRAGRHDITMYDWDRYLDFADKHMRNHTQ